MGTLAGNTLSMCLKPQQTAEKNIPHYLWGIVKMPLVSQCVNSQANFWQFSSVKSYDWYVDNQLLIQTLIWRSDLEVTPAISPPNAPAPLAASSPMFLKTCWTYTCFCCVIQNPSKLFKKVICAPVDLHVCALVILAKSGNLVPGVPHLDRPMVGHRPNKHLASQLNRAIPTEKIPLRLHFVVVHTVRKKKNWTIKKWVIKQLLSLQATVFAKVCRCSSVASADKAIPFPRFGLNLTAAPLVGETILSCMGQGSKDSAILQGMVHY